MPAERADAAPRRRDRRRTHQVQQTIYLATAQDKAAGSRTGRLFKIIAVASPDDARDDDAAAACKLESLRAHADASTLELRCHGSPRLNRGPTVPDVAGGRRSRLATTVNARATDICKSMTACSLPHLVNGLTLGLLFALVALGFMLIVGVMEVINLAHGSLFALGAYFAMTMWPRHAAAGRASRRPGGRCLSARATAVALVLAPAAGRRSSAWRSNRAMRRTYGRDPLYGLLLTFGAALVIEETIRLVWGSAEQVLPVPAGITGGFIAGGMI